MIDAKDVVVFMVNQPFPLRVEHIESAIEIAHPKVAVLVKRQSRDVCV